MMSIWKRVAGVGAAAALFATTGPVALAGAATLPVAVPAPAPIVYPAGPIGAAFQAGTEAAIGGLNAGADGAVGGWNAGAAALGLPFQFTINTWGPYHVPGVAPLNTTTP
jgi:hypothetical protein